MKVPPLTCPLCNGTRVSKSRSGSIECEDCNSKISKDGKVEKKDSTNPTAYSKKKNYPDDFFN